MGYAANGDYSGTNNATGFSYGPDDLLGTNPSFASATVPPAPSCAGAAGVPKCMATVIANFTPTTAAAQSSGYQIPSAALVNDSLFPQWLCNVNLPGGLLTMGCANGEGIPTAPTGLTATVE